MANDTRDRIVFATANLFRRQGYTGTGMKQIATDAKAPFGSVYHFFPGGKEQLGAEVIERGGRFFGALVGGVFEAAPDLLTGIRDCFEGAAETLRTTNYEDACPIATVSLEVSSTNETLRRASAAVFAGWVEGAAPRFEAAGLDPNAAREQAMALIMSLEGAFLLARAMRSTEPLEVAGRVTLASTEAALTARAAA